MEFLKDMYGDARECFKSDSFKKNINEGLRSVEITYDDGTVTKTNMSANLTDKEIRDYFKIGKSFNIGSIDDKMVKVKKVNILK